MKLELGPGFSPPAVSELHRTTYNEERKEMCSFCWLVCGFKINRKVKMEGHTWHRNGPKGNKFMSQGRTSFLPRNTSIIQPVFVKLAGGRP